MRIVHMSDNHLGKAQFHLAEREEDLYKAFDMAVDLALQQDPDLVIHTGDLFDSYRPHPRAFVRAFDGLLRIVERGIPVAIIEGNHELGPDTVRRRIASPLINMRKLFERLGYGSLFVRLGPGAVRIGDVIVAGAPYASRGVRIADTVESLNRKAKNLCDDCPKVLMIHQGVRGMIKAIYPEVDFSEIAKSSFDYVAMGHYHNKVVRRSGGRVFAYSGSTEVIETREIPLAGEGKYILSIDLGRDGIEVEELRLRTRPFLYFSETLNNMRDLYVLIEELKGKLESQTDGRPIVYGKVSLGGDVRPGVPTQEIRRALADLSLYVIVRESKVAEDDEERSVLTGVGLEELVQNAISSLDLDQDVRSLALRVFDMWYREGKRGEAFVKGVLSLMEDDQ